jgi:hypothetical protein
VLLSYGISELLNALTSQKLIYERCVQWCFLFRSLQQYLVSFEALGASEEVIFPIYVRAESNKKTDQLYCQRILLRERGGLRILRYSPQIFPLLHCTLVINKLL